jgi:hypothetical protein
MYGHFIDLPGSFATNVERVVAALKAEGFGILSDIDVQKTCNGSARRCSRVRSALGFDDLHASLPDR